MHPLAAFHLSQFAREQLELGADELTFRRGVHTLDVGDEDLDGREVDTVTLTVDGRELVAVEAALIADAGGTYTAELSRSLLGDIPA